MIQKTSSSLLMQDSTDDKSQPITELFHAQVSSTPNATAVLFGDQSISYAELSVLANKIAQKLQSHRFKRESRVGVCLDRSHYAIAAMLGIMKAGLAFVPLDPDFPPSRLKYMIEDSGIKCCITENNYCETIEPLIDHIYRIETDFAEPVDLAILNELEIDPAHLAYVMYTSGSTGNPKGVQIEHQALTNYCLADAQAYQLTASDVTLQFSTLNFDIAIEEIFPPLITGSAIAVRPQQRSDEFNELSALIERYNVTAIHVATAYWHEWVNLLSSTGEATPKTVRLMVVTGEKVSSQHYRTWLKQTRHEVLWANAYGPTETTVTATVFIPQKDWIGDNLPIGKPLDGYTARILDSELQDVKLHETGELYIGGFSLARGYLNRPDLTEQSFVIASDGERLYKTGDLARYLDTGDIEYAGRIDHQIKIGSYRIEPGEIEEAINKHPDVHESLVMATDERAAGNRQIIAYLGCQNTLSVHQIHEFLSNHLPPFMLPAAYLRLDSLPKTINGKIDREALPSPYDAEFPTAAEFSQAQSTIELELVSIWSNILGRTSIGVTDNFFDLGGSSLGVTQCILQIYQTLGTAPTAREFYAKPTIAQLAELLENTGDTTSRLSTNQSLTGDKIELTDSQYQIWFQQKLHPELSIYNIYEAFDIEGNLDIEKLEAVVKQLIINHGVLRVSFSEKDGRCYQSFGKADQLDSVIKVTDDQTLNPNNWMREVIQRKFDLLEEPVYRFALLKYAENRYRLVLTVHHIISDGWSMTLLVRELSKNYNQLVEAAETSPESKDKTEFSDYVSFTNSQKSTDAHQQQLDYWKEQLASVTPHELPQASPVVGDRHFTADVVSFELNVSEQRIKSVCDEHSITPFMLLLGAFKALLHRYSPVEKVTVAVAHSGRSWPEIEDTFGLFVNTLITRTEISADDSAALLLSRIRQSSIDAFANQEISLAELVTTLRPDRRTDTMPFTPFLFLMQDIPDTDLVLSDIKASSCAVPPENVDYDLLLEITEHPRQPEKPYSARLIFADEIYSRSDMERLKEHYQRLIDAMLIDSATPIGELPILGEHETRFLLDTVNRTHLDYPLDSSLCEELWKVAGRFPDKTAVRFEAKSMTYRELQNHVELLAGYLVSHQAGPNTLVAVFVERGIDMLIALLAIQQAGAAYLPMDPLYPSERIEYIINDAQAPLLITQSTLKDSIPNLDTTIICIDQDWERIAQGKALDSPAVADRTDLAYVIYTSGSTGKPKGVQLTRQNVLNFLYAMKERPGLESTDTLTAVTTISFDIAVLELYLPLLSGACVDIVSRETAINGQALANRLQETSATAMQATPATWRLLLETSWTHPRGFKALIGGEALPQELITPLLQRCDELWNMYGPTETTVWSTCAQIIDGDELPSIGSPIGNTQIYILSEHNQPSPIGVPGELCIGGDGVAAGYANRPELTTEKFVTNSLASSGRIYRTGDSARWRSDGTLEFLGRLDNQIKLRGYRIEPGEIEKVICKRQAIEQAVVTVNTLSEGEMLTAYVVSSDPINEQQLRDYLSKSLPDYMIPSLWVTMEALPLTPNGKIDRKALPSPERPQVANRSNTQPITDTERAVSELWSTLLPGSKPGRDDNFFSLGGHSLLAMRFIARAEDRFGYSIPIRSLMSENLARIAEQLNPDDHALHEKSPTPTPKIEVAFNRYLGRSIFTALHYPSTTEGNHSTTARAVLLCQPIGHEYLRMHKCTQRLACELAKKGHTVLRFDYSGTGDSEGEFSESRLEIWQEDIERAHQLLKSKSGFEDVTLIGIRLGAPLVMSTQLTGIDRIVLWDPVISGSQWLAQQKALHQYELKNLDRYRWSQKRTREHEMVGYQYSLNLIKDIRHLELGSSANKFNENTLIINSSSSQMSTLLSKDFPHSLTNENLITVDDNQRWEDERSVDDMVLGHLGIQEICDRL